MKELVWSDWTDFNRQTIEQVPDDKGVFVTHANMKILKIGGADNLRASLLSLLNDACVAKSKRFRYSLTVSYADEVKRLLKEYTDKHGGSIPECM